MAIFKRMLKQRFFFILIFFLYALNAFSQKAKVDALLSQLHKNDPDTVQIQVMRKLSAAYTLVDPIKKYEYANKYRLLAEKNHIDSLVATAYIDIGISFGVRGDLDSSLYYFDLGFAKSKAINYEAGMAKAHGNIGYSLDRLERKKEAIEHYEAALNLYEKLGLRQLTSQIIVNLGAIYFDMNEYKIADAYFRQTLERVKETPSNKVGLGSALYSLGNSNMKLGNAKKSLDYFRQSLAIRTEIGDINGIALSNMGIGRWYNDQKDFKRALPYLKTALKTNNQVNDTYHGAAILGALAECYFGLKDYKEARKIANQALAAAKKSNAHAGITMSLDLLSQISKEEKKYDEALKYQADYIKASDSLDLAATKKEVFARDLQRVNSDNSRLEKHNRTILARNEDYVMIITIISILLIIVVILLILYYKRNGEKKASNRELQQHQLEIAEVNEKLSEVNEELMAQMEIVSAQNERLAQLNQVKNKFFSIVSHDLRGPLNNLRALLELYRGSKMSEDELREVLSRLEETTLHTVSFLDNLLEWSRSQLEGIITKPVRVDMQAIIDEKINLMTTQIQSKQVIVENHVGANQVVFADKDMIKLVVRNLLSNAIKFCHAGDHITFSSTVEANKLIWRIHDTGPGINDVTDLFKLSNRMSKGTAGETGYHIGLVLVHDMLMRNKGSIRVSSQSGEGTTFEVTLPLAGAEILHTE